MKTIGFDIIGCFEFLLSQARNENKNDIEFSLRDLIDTYAKNDDEHLCENELFEMYLNLFCNAANAIRYQLLFSNKEDVEIKCYDLFLQGKKHFEIEQILKLPIKTVRKYIYKYKQSKAKKIIGSELIFDNERHTIIIKKNEKKQQYEYLIELLREFGHPMHFTDLFKLCVSRNIEFKSDINVHATLQRYDNFFGLKGPGTYGLKEWGGCFGSIGDVSEKYLKDNNCPVYQKELEEFICSELIVSQDSIREVLFNYLPEKRFVRIKGGMVGLKEWQNNNLIIKNEKEK